MLALFLRVANDRKARRSERLARRWEPALLEVLGETAPPEALFARVDERDGVRFLSFLLRYARLLRGDERDLVRTLARPYLPALLPRVERGTPETRGNAVLMFARMGMPTHADVVARALSDESPIVSMIAARSLFRPGHEEYFPAVLEHLPRFTGWSRGFLASMLAGGGPAAAPLLRTIMADAARPALVRAVASDALRELNDLESVPLALRLMTRKHDRELVAGCLRILKQLGHAGHVGAVRELTASEDPVIRAAAVAAAAALGGESEVELMQDRLDDDSFWVSLEAARGLLALGAEATLERLAASDGPWSTLARQVLSE